MKMVYYVHHHDYIADDYTADTLDKLRELHNDREEFRDMYPNPPLKVEIDLSIISFAVIMLWAREGEESRPFFEQVGSGDGWKTEAVEL